MSIYSEEVQNLTDQLVAEVTTLHDLANTDPPDMQAIGAATDTVEATATSLDQTVKSADVPADGSMVLNLTTQILVEIPILESAIGASDIEQVKLVTDKVVETTMNINRTVTRMSENQGPGPTAADTPVPPWFYVPTTPAPAPEGTQ